MRCFVLPTFLFASFCKGCQLRGDLLLDCSWLLYLVGGTQEVNGHLVLQRQGRAALQAGTVPASQLWPLQELQPGHTHPDRAFQRREGWVCALPVEADRVTQHLGLREEKGTGSDGYCPHGP